MKKPLASSPAGSRLSIAAELEEFVEDEGKMRELKEESESPKSERGNEKVARVMDVFRSISPTSTVPSKVVEALPPTIPQKNIFATLPSTAVARDGDRPSSAARRSPVREEGGLLALEARLARPVSPQVSSSSPFTTTFDRPTSIPSSSVPTRVDQLRSLSPPQTTTALRARSISRASKEAELAKMLAKEDPKDALRKLASSAPPLSPSVPRQSFSSSSAIPPHTSSHSIPRATPSSSPLNARPTSSPSIPRPTTSARAETALPTSTPFATTMERDEEQETESIISPSISASQVGIEKRYREGKKGIELQEVSALKKDAVGRIGNWLKASKIESAGAEIDLPVEREKPKSAKRHSFEIVRHAPPPPLFSTSKSTPRLPQEQEPTVKELLAADSHEEFVTTIQSKRAMPSADGGLAPPFPRSLSVDDISSKYDIKSARGGRGGVVASVAGLWAAKVVEEVRLPTC